MKHKLSDAQMKELKKAVIDKTPDQLKFDFALWSSKAIKEYVQREYGMSISRRTARRYMQKLRAEKGLNLLTQFHRYS